MPPSNLAVILGISTLLLRPAATVGADGPASPADLAKLASREQQLRSKVDDRMRARVLAVTEAHGEALAVSMTELLRPQYLRVAQGDRRALLSKPVLTDGRAKTRVQPVADTACTRVGHTLVCVLREVASR